MTLKELKTALSKYPESMDNMEVLHFIENGQERFTACVTEVIKAISEEELVVLVGKEFILIR